MHNTCDVLIATNGLVTSLNSAAIIMDSVVGRHACVPRAAELSARTGYIASRS